MVLVMRSPRIERLPSGSSAEGGSSGEKSRSDDARKVGFDCESRRRDGR
jgi:hypothetical protein